MKKGSFQQLLVIFVILLLLFVTGCGGSGSSINNSDSELGRVVTSDFAGTYATWDEVLALKKGTPLLMRTGSSGTEVRDYPVTFVSAGQDGSARFFLFEVDSTASVMPAPGFSGSPILSADGTKMFGALNWGGFDANIFAARFVGDMNATGETRTAPSVIDGKYRPIGLNYSLVLRGGEGFFKGRINSNAKIASPADLPGATSRGGGHVLMAGSPVVIALISGPMVSYTASGTTSHTSGGRAVLFGHSLEAAGPARFPIFPGTTIANVDAMKWILPVGTSPIGATTWDGDAGVRVAMGNMAPRTEVVVHTTYKGKVLPAVTHFTADDPKSPFLGWGWVPSVLPTVVGTQIDDFSPFAPYSATITFTTREGVRSTIPLASAEPRRVLEDIFGAANTSIPPSGVEEVELQVSIL